MRLAEKIEAARAEIARLERQALSATCADMGCKMVGVGGANCGCMFTDDDGCECPGSCSVPVNKCSRCGDCDYGENDEAADVRRHCADKRADFSTETV